MLHSMTPWLLALMTPMLGGCLLLADPPILTDDPPRDGWIDVEVVGFTVCGLREQGTVWCGEAGDLKLVDDAPYVTLSGGLQGGINGVREDGGLVIGVGSDVASERPGPFVDVSGDSFAGCGLLPSGGVECWPDEVSVSGPFTAIGAGTSFACGLREGSGALGCWSIDDGFRAEALDQVPGASGYRQVEANREVGCALASGGAIRCWGYDSFTDLTDAPSGTYSHLSLANDVACAVREATGSAKCWGSGTYVLALPPVDVEFVTVEAGDDRSCGIDTESRLHCW